MSGNGGGRNKGMLSSSVLGSSCNKGISRDRDKRVTLVFGVILYNHERFNTVATQKINNHISNTFSIIPI